MFIFISCHFTSISIQCIRLVDKNYEITAYFNSQKSADKFDYIKDYYTVPNSKNVLFKEKNNVVLVMGESLESNFNFTEPMSKELDKIERKGESVTKFVNATGSSWTIGALTGWHFGLPLKITVKYENSFVPIGNLHNTYDSKRVFLPNAKPIFEILKANGYKTVLFLGSDSNFSGMKNCFQRMAILKYYIKITGNKKDGILINIKALVGDSLIPSFLQEQKKNT